MQSNHARHIVETLNQAGFIAYYAGGWVRDFLLQQPSDDIDIATNAPPETIQALFPHTVPIGIAFGIILVVIEGHPFEVATFRRDFDYQDGRRPNRIEFATAIEDAKRRDFTINGMFYDPIQEKIYDYVHGQEDLQAKILRAIGNPHERFQEDRLRMIRAVRFACRFQLQIDPQTEEAIRQHASEIVPAVAIERIWQEITKGHAFGHIKPMLLQMHCFGLLAPIFPELEAISLPDLEKRLLALESYPREAPVIASLLPLFPQKNLAQQLELCKKLKLSNQESQFVTFLSHIQRLVQQKETVENVEWAYAYANPFSTVCLEILRCHLDQHQAALFIKQHEERRAFLKSSIERIHHQNPLVKSEHLLQAGIQPGKKMGVLLKEAERLSINEQLQQPEEVIAKLKKTIYW